MAKCHRAFSAILVALVLILHMGIGESRYGLRKDATPV